MMLIAPILYLTLLACSPKKTTPVTANTTGTGQTAVMLPSFSVIDANGRTLNLQQLKGKKVFVNLWASWCPPCRIEMPGIEKLYKSVDSSKVAFIMLALDNDFETSKSFMQKKGYTMPAFYPNENLPAIFNVPGIPATFIFNEKGELIQKIEGGDNYDTDSYRQMLK